MDTLLTHASSNLKTGYDRIFNLLCDSRDLKNKVFDINLNIALGTCKPNMIVFIKVYLIYKEKSMGFCGGLWPSASEEAMKGCIRAGYMHEHRPQY